MFADITCSSDLDCSQGFSCKAGICKGRIGYLDLEIFFLQFYISSWSNFIENQFFLFSFLVAEIDCVWGEWQIGDCSKTCGVGIVTMTRIKIVEEAYGGKCEGGSTMQESCNKQDCPGNVPLLTYIL